MSIAQIRVRPETDVGYTGVSAPTRKRVADGPVVLEEMPAWLEIKETDDEKTKARKRKLQKSYKSKQRFQKMDKASQEKQKSWQDFLAVGLVHVPAHCNRTPTTTNNRGARRRKRCHS